MDADTYLAGRRTRSDERLTAFAERLATNIPSSEMDELIGAHTCVYAVGSGGRGELGDHSDLDVFLVRSGKPRSRMDEARLQTAVFRAMREARFEEPSRDGEFITLHTLEAMIERLGGSRDDPENTFTGRMLLLLESRPLLGSEVYKELVSRSLDAYWKNLAGHQEDYLPIILLNDIVRYWRIVLLNYEARTAERLRELESSSITDPARRGTEDAKITTDRRIRSLKLRFARCLMCYASVAYLLAEARATKAAGGDANVTKDRVAEMVTMTPLERLSKAVAVDGSPEVVSLEARLRGLYADFLTITDRPKSELAELVSDRARREAVFTNADQFGSSMFELVEALGRDNPLYRYVVV